MPEILHELFQNFRIRRNEQSASQAHRRVSGAERTTQELEAELERLMLIAHALWELLSEATGTSEEQLLLKLREIDLRSGKLDGRAPSSPVSCPSCDRTVNLRHKACIYCGAEINASPFSGQ